MKRGLLRNGEWEKGGNGEAGKWRGGETGTYEKRGSGEMGKVKKLGDALQISTFRKNVGDGLFG